MKRCFFSLDEQPFGVSERRKNKSYFFLELVDFLFPVSSSRFPPLFFLSPPRKSENALLFSSSSSFILIRIGRKKGNRKGDLSVFFLISIPSQLFSTSKPSKRTKKKKKHHQNPPQAPSSSSSSSSTAANACKLAPETAPPGQKIATFAGGCFWGLELAYQREPGVTATSVGYTGGKDPSPTYESVCRGVTGHAEAVQVYYDPAETTYERLLALFFERVDPTTLNRQGNDVGTQYRSAIYYHDDEQKALAEKAIAEVDAKLASNVFRRVLGTKVVSELVAAGPYYLAEDYHQQYLSKGGRFGSGQSAAKGCKDPIRCYG